MAKPNKSQKPTAQQNSSASQNAVATAFQKATSALASTVKISNPDGPIPTMPESIKGQLNLLEKVGDEKKNEVEEVLQKLADVAKAATDLHESIVNRNIKLIEKEENFTKKELAFSKNNSAFNTLNTDLKSRQEKISKTETELANKERALELRELAARNGFADQNLLALSDLKKEISELEAKKNALQIEILKIEGDARDDQQQRNLILIQRESDLSVKEKELNQQQLRLDVEWKEIERMRPQIVNETMQEVALEIKRLKDARQRSEERLANVYRDWTIAEQKLEQFTEFSEALAGRTAREVMEELSISHRRIIQLENQLANNQDKQLESDNESLRMIRDELKLQLDEVYAELSDTKGQLHRLRLGVSDKENLEKEKRSLEKNNQILSSRLNDLGKTVDDLTQSQNADKPFPQLAWMDTASITDWVKEKSASELTRPVQDVPELKKFAVDLQHRIAQAEVDTSLYFQLQDIQLLIAGLAMSQLHIFQGISGTGKTSLAKAFAKAVGGHCTDIAVQAGWRDRDDLLGHYNAFEKRFYERDCLQGLYRAQTKAYSDRCNIILLDEMNLSRPEQYFAEFLSALEKNDSKDRVISLSESQLPNAPSNLDEGRKIYVPHNVWFVGTANHDETTNEFADKTYDRAHVMTLPRHESSFLVEEKTKSSFSFSSLLERFEDAIDKHSSDVDDLLSDLTTGPLTILLQDRFDLGWGNRFERQAKRFIPVYMATGGKKEDALDHLLASRVFRRGKVTGRYDATVEDLKEIETALLSIWKNWKSKPSRSLELIAEDRRRKERGA